MSPSNAYLNPTEAARRLGVSAKALRLYEQRGLVTPVRTEAGWRAYGPAEMARAGEVAALRALGLSLAETARVLAGDAQGLAPALATHQAGLEDRARQLADTLERVRRLRTGLVQGEAPAIGELTRLVAPAMEVRCAFDLPWPWGGERFELRDVRALTYIIGPLGSGKTRLAMRIAETLPGAAFLGLDRFEDDRAAARASGAALAADAGLKRRTDAALAWLEEDGATASDALSALVAGVEAEGPAALVVDMVEQGLDQATQEAAIAWLRRRGPGARPLLLMTRSSAILDLGLMGEDEAIILCPANHSPPMRVPACPGAPGYEAVATCLASPNVRARTEGMRATRPNAA